MLRPESGSTPAHLPPGRVLLRVGVHPNRVELTNARIDTGGTQVFADTTLYFNPDSGPGRGPRARRESRPLGFWPLGTGLRLAAEVAAEVEIAAPTSAPQLEARLDLRRVSFSGASRSEWCSGQLSYRDRVLSPPVGHRPEGQDPVLSGTTTSSTSGRRSLQVGAASADPQWPQRRSGGRHLGAAPSIEQLRGWCWARRRARSTSTAP